ncbi:MAG: proline--tRNA ligase [Patescibacteria group bacterium]
MNKSSSIKITPRHEDYSKWYNDIVAKADLAEHAPVKGCMIIKPYGYAIWENIQVILDQKIKAQGVVNAYFPLFIPKSFIEKEKEHVEGFSPELAVVTHGGGKKLEEPLIVRPTSETIMYDAYSRWIKSYRDLPLLINQWANVVRWEKRPRPFIRTTEFLWQEGHTAHATHEEALTMVLTMLDVYHDFARDYLAMPTIKGQKSQTEKFAGAVATYSFEPIMQDGKALQGGTSHLLGQNFAKAFNIQYLDEKNQLQYVHQTSWGVSTRLMGALIMSHSDDQGLRLPPNIAPIQIVIIPIYKSEEDKKAVLSEVEKIKAQLVDYSVKVDNDEAKSPGWKFNEWEQKGVPVRIEIGPKDVAKEKVVVSRRDNGQKTDIKINELARQIPDILNSIQNNLLDEAQERLTKNSHIVDDWEEFKKIIAETPGFIYAHWCHDPECGDNIKEITQAKTINTPLDQKEEKGKCIKCGKESNKRIIFAKSY